MADSAIIQSRTFNVPVNNIDTDQIIPAQFLTMTERKGLGRLCFHDWRFNDDGSDRKDNPLVEYQPERQQILVAGSNFGCGSSREHAPWALLDFGFRAVISDRFADIFRNNSLKNGLLPITVDKKVVEYLLARPDHPVHIDIHNRKLTIDGFGSCEFPLDPFSAYCITRGIDQLDFILDHEQDITAYEQRYGK
jgi:3-isopropylmalate/(R)-2-methylmalate dehydratase small subunit